MQRRLQVVGLACEGAETAQKNSVVDAIVFTQINKYNIAADAGVITCITKRNKSRLVVWR